MKKKRTFYYASVKKVRNFKGSGCRGRNCILVRATSQVDGEEEELRFVGYYQVGEFHRIRKYVYQVIMLRLMIDHIKVYDDILVEKETYYRS